MSNFGAVPSAILSAINGAITLGGYRDGAISYAKIPADQFPFAMAYNPQKKIDRIDFKHGTETTANPILVVWKNATIATVNADVVSIEAALNGSTLGGIVEDTWVSVVGRDEGLDSNLIAAVFQVDTRGTV